MKIKIDRKGWAKRLQGDLDWLRDSVPWCNERDHIRAFLTSLLDADPNDLDKFLDEQRGLRQAERHLDKVDPNRVLSTRYVNLRKRLRHIMSYAGPSPDNGKEAAGIRGAMAELERILIPEVAENTT